MVKRLTGCPCEFLYPDGLNPLNPGNHGQASNPILFSGGRDAGSQPTESRQPWSSPSDGDRFLPLSLPSSLNPLNPGNHGQASLSFVLIPRSLLSLNPLNPGNHGQASILLGRNHEYWKVSTH